MINPGTPYWVGEHWINYLRNPDTGADSGVISLWTTHYCTAGNGIVAVVDIPGVNGFQGVCTNNLEVMQFVAEWYNSLGSIYNFGLPIVESGFSFGGDIRTRPAWTIQAAEDQIIATWLEPQSAIILNAPAPELRPDRDVSSLLFFTDEATITVNGRAVVGQPFLRDIWRRSIGGDRSSCVFALAETFILSARTQENSQ